ncbi:MAG: molybdopterin molybdotransferase MoeA [Nocardioidaceae bacterium]|nr:MAG: molybdopterin molybdotransferase MoeA [Nocardioidaceae bacterium]
MSSAEPLTSVDEHLDEILAAINPLPPYDQPLIEALSLPICESIVSPIDLPSFDNSAMDGYAVCFADVASASEDHPVTLPVTGEVAAGQTKLFAMSPGTAVKIMTGAPVPQGADSVVPYEWTDRGVAHVRISKAPELGQHLRRRGEDVKEGDLVLEDGRLLGARQIGLLASIGRAQVSARPRPRVVVMSTGSELREPGTALGHDSIYDSNSYMLAAAVRAAGAIAYRVGMVTDDPQEFADALSDQLVRADMVVTSGGVSKGDYDVVKEVLSDLGTVTFREVAMQPGKPQGFGFVGEDSTPIFTLPGNPVSSFVSFEAFVLPAIRRMMGRLPYRRPLVRALLTKGLSAPAGRETYARGTFEIDGKGAHVTPAGSHGSHLLGDLSDANALIVIDAETTHIPAGEHVQVMVLDRDY